MFCVLLHGLQGNLCSSAWSTFSPFSSVSSRIVSLTQYPEVPPFCLLSPRPPEPAVSNMGQPWSFLTGALQPPATSALPWCHGLPMQFLTHTLRTDKRELPWVLPWLPYMYWFYMIKTTIFNSRVFPLGGISLKWQTNISWWTESQSGRKQKRIW